MVTSVEIECLKRYGAEFNFMPMDILSGNGCVGIYWENSTEKLFSDYFEPIKVEKTKHDKLKKNGDTEYNPTLRNITKLLLNSLSGKLVQKNFLDKTQLVKNVKDEEKFEKKVENIELKLMIGPYRILKGDLKSEYVYSAKKSKTILFRSIYICLRKNIYVRHYFFKL